MNKDDKKVIDEFKKHARPVDMQNFIMQQEILVALKNIRYELKKLNEENLTR